MTKLNHKIFNLIVMIIIIFTVGVFFINVPYSMADEPSEEVVEETSSADEDRVIVTYEKDYQKEEIKEYDDAEDSFWTTTNKNDIFKTIRANVAKWYYLLRYISIAVMLIVLLVLGIKLALASLAPKRALYKRMLVDWVVCFIILFMAHYFMIFVQYMNQTLLNIFKDMSNEMFGEANYNLYETVKSRAYDLKFTVGFSGMILYMTLLYLTVKYIYIYLKRLITIVILTISAPLVTLFYSFQKIWTGKSKTLSRWMEEYATNVLLQSIQALCYVVFVGSAMKLTDKSLFGVIIAFIFLGFMSNAEKIFRTIFKFSDGSSIADELSQSRLEEITSGIRGAVMGAVAIKSTPIGKAMMAPYKPIAKAGVHMASAAKDFKIGSFSPAEGLAKTRQAIEDWDSKQYEKKVSKQQAIVDSMGLDQDGNPRTLSPKAQKQLEKAQAKLDKYTRQQGQHDFRLGVYERLRDALDPDNYLEYVRYAEDTTDAYGETHKKGSAVLKHRQKRTLGIGKFSVRIDSINKHLFKNPKARYVRRVKKREKVFNKRTGEYEYRGGVAEVIAAKKHNILGLTADQKALVDEALGAIKKNTLGFGALLLGMGSVIDTPVLGLPMLGYGLHNLRGLPNKSNVVFDRRARKAIKKIGGGKGVLKRTVFDEMETQAEQDELNFKRDVAVETMKVLAEEAKAQYEQLMQQALEHKQQTQTKTLVEEARIDDGTIVKIDDDHSVVFNSLENQDTMSVHSAYRSAIIETALELGIYDLDELDLDDKRTRSVLIEKLKAKGVLSYEDSIDPSKIEEILHGKIQIPEFRASAIGGIKANSARMRIAQASLSTLSDCLLAENIKELNCEEIIMRQVLVDHLVECGWLDSADKEDAVKVSQASRLHLDTKTKMNDFVNSILVSEDNLQEQYSEKGIEGLMELLQNDEDPSTQSNDEIFARTAMVRGMIAKGYLSFADRNNLDKIREAMNANLSTLEQQRLFIESLTRNRIRFSRETYEDIGVEGVIESLQEIEADVLKQKAFERIVARYVKENGITSVSQLREREHKRKIFKYFHQEINKNPNDGRMVSIAARIGRDITTISADELLSAATLSERRMIREHIFKGLSEAQKVTFESARKIDDATLRTSINTRLKQIDISFNSALLGTLANNGITTNFEALDLDNPSNAGIRWQIINAAKKTGVSTSEEDIVAMAHKKLETVTQEQVEETMISNYMASFIEHKCGGDPSLIQTNDSLRESFEEGVADIIIDTRSKSANQGTIDNIVDLIQAGRKSGAEVEQIAEKKKFSMFGAEDEDEKKKDPYLDPTIPTPSVKTELVDDKVICTFSIPAGLDEEIKLETCKKSLTAKNENFIEGIDVGILTDPNEVVCARLRKGEYHGATIIIKYPPDAIKIIDQMLDKQEDDEQRKKDEESANAVLEKLLFADSSTSEEDKLGEETVRNSEDKELEDLFKAREMVKVRNGYQEVIDDIMAMRDELSNPDSKKKVGGEIVEFQDRLDELSGGRESFGSDTEYDDYKRSSDMLLMRLLQMKMLDEDADALKLRKEPKKNKKYNKAKKSAVNSMKSYNTQDVINSIFGKS